MQENQYILLLTKQWSGDISREEAAMLKAWLEASPENVSTAEALQVVWESSTEPTLPFVVDVDADFRALQLRLKTEPNKRMVPIFGRIIRTAAAVLVLGGAVWAYHSAFPAQVMTTVAVMDEAVRQIKLPDGTKVWLRQHSSITYPENFTGSNRTVSIQGEVYFDVKLALKHPFQVKLPSKGMVEVLGTQFAVNARNQEPSVLVRSGKVRFQPNESSRDVLLTAYQAAAYHGENKSIIVRNLTSLNELSWQSGGLEFVRTPLARVVEDLEKHYNVSIDLENTNLADCLHTAPLTNQSIDNVLASLALTYGLQVKQISPAQYLLSGGSCN